MDLAIADLSPGKRYRLMTALVVPRPIAWITTLAPEGHVNAAPFSYFNVLGSDPLVVAVGFARHADGREKDTALHIRATGRFTVNLVDESVAEAMHATSAPLPPEASEIEQVGLETVAMGAPGDGWSPRVAGVPAAMACREHATHLVGQTRIVLGVAERLYVRDSLADERGYVDLDAVRAVGRLGGARYTRLDPFSLGPRPPAET